MSDLESLRRKLDEAWVTACQASVTDPTGGMSYQRAMNEWWQARMKYDGARSLEKMLRPHFTDAPKP